MAFAFPMPALCNVGAVGEGSVPLMDVPSAVTWSEVPDDTTFDYELITSMPNILFETGTAAKTTLRGVPVLVRTANGVATGSNGTGALVNFPCEATIRIGPPEMDQGVTSFNGQAGDVTLDGEGVAALFSTPEVTGSNGQNEALANLLVALDSMGLIKDSTTTPT